VSFSRSAIKPCASAKAARVSALGTLSSSGKAHRGERFGGFGFQFVIQPDVEHGTGGTHAALLYLI
jgi:hypothetical protein